MPRRPSRPWNRERRQQIYAALLRPENAPSRSTLDAANGEKAKTWDQVEQERAS